MRSCFFDWDSPRGTWNMSNNAAERPQQVSQLSHIPMGDHHFPSLKYEDFGSIWGQCPILQAPPGTAGICQIVDPSDTNRQLQCTKERSIQALQVQRPPPVGHGPGHGHGDIFFPVHWENPWKIHESSESRIGMKDLLPDDFSSYEGNRSK